MKPLVILGLALMTPPLVNAQSPVPTYDDREANLSTYIELLRKDLGKQRVAIVTEVMALSPAEAAGFWPVYNEYDKARTGLGSEAFALVRVFTEARGALTESQAHQLTSKSLELEARRTAVKRAYFEKMSKATSARLAARWLQVENQIEMIMGLQLSASLPLVEGAGR